MPPEYTVEFNGAVLGEKYIADDSVEYELLAEFYEDFDLPHMVKYHVDGYISDPVVTVRDGAGTRSTRRSSPRSITSITVQTRRRRSWTRSSSRTSTPM